MCVRGEINLMSVRGILRMLPIYRVNFFELYAVCSTILARNNDLSWRGRPTSVNNTHL